MGLQQPLPFTVLKLVILLCSFRFKSKLQQPLPFTVLKLTFFVSIKNNTVKVATAITVYGIETR